jgi:hypothetical protein
MSRFWPIFWWRDSNIYAYLVSSGLITSTAGSSYTVLVSIGDRWSSDVWHLYKGFQNSTIGTRPVDGRPDEVFAKTLENFQHSTRHISDKWSHTLSCSCEVLRTSRQNNDAIKTDVVCTRFRYTNRAISVPTIHLHLGRSITVLLH